MVAAHLETIGQLTWGAEPVGGSSVDLAYGGVGITNTRIGYYSGFRVIVSEELPILGTTGQAQQFVSYLFSPGEVRTGSQFPLEIRTEENLPSLQTNLYYNFSSLFHVMGTTWKSAADHPENSDLADVDNWDIAYDEPRWIRCMCA